MTIHKFKKSNHMEILFKTIGNTLVKLVRDGLQLRLGNAGWAQSNDELVPLGQVLSMMGRTTFDVIARVGQQETCNGKKSNVVTRLDVVPGVMVTFEAFSQNAVGNATLEIGAPDGILTSNYNNPGFDTSVEIVEMEVSSGLPDGEYEAQVLWNDGVTYISRVVYFTLSGSSTSGSGAGI